MHNDTQRIITFIITKLLCPYEIVAKNNLLYLMLNIILILISKYYNTTQQRCRSRSDCLLWSDVLKVIGLSPLSARLAECIYGNTSFANVNVYRTRLRIRLISSLPFSVTYTHPCRLLASSYSYLLSHCSVHGVSWLSTGLFTCCSIRSHSAMLMCFTKVAYK